VVVDFFVAGVQKGGTTALDALLRRAGVAMALQKETHFFDDDGRDWTAPDYGELHKYFTPIGCAPRGEATPIYSYWPNALERIAGYNPNAKIIFCLRHPSLRAHSQWRMETARGFEYLPFPKAIREAGRQRVRSSEGGVHRNFSYVERGFYSGQARRAISLFGWKHVLFIRTDVLWEAPSAVLSDVCKFLAIPHFARTHRSEYCVPVDARALGSIPWSDRRYLDELYKAEIQETAAVTGLDLNDWLHESYREPMPSKFSEHSAEN
jgi:hypothetical protein